LADPQRLDVVETWTQSGELWSKRAALVATLPWTKQNNPKPEELDARERILGWAAGYLPVKNGILQKAIAWWVRDLSRHDPVRAAAFIEDNRATLKPYPAGSPGGSGRDGGRRSPRIRQLIPTENGRPRFPLGRPFCILHRHRVA